jgi:hypothetical protein
VYLAFYQEGLEMDCPVCADANAKDITAHDFDGKSFRCPKCGDYDVAGSVWDPCKLQDLALEQRLVALTKAKRFAEPNKRPLVSSACL